MSSITTTLRQDERPDGDTDPLHPPATKQQRNRSQLSCRPCRTGKLKCDRSHPCNQCVKRSREESCRYAPPARKRASTTAGQTVRNRVNQLEQLVLDLMNDRQTGDQAGKTSQSISPRIHQNGTSRLTPQEDASLTSDIPTDVPLDTQIGRMVIERSGTSYVGDTHWRAILGGISDLKREVCGSGTDDEEGGDATLSGSDEAPTPADARPQGVNGLLRSPKRLSRLELIAALPERHIVDRLLYQWFRSPDPFTCCVHPPTFQIEYQRFWSNPSRTPVMWVGLLFTILSVSVQITYFTHRDQSSSDAQQMLADALHYHELAASAAVLADYLRPQKYVLECLMLYTSSLRNTSAFVDIWHILGVIIRLALRMGYHRDGSHFPDISVFDKEMRRRVWHGVYMLDVLVSFQVGLPNMIKTVVSDTLPPNNFQDVDLHTAMQQLPEPRPAREFTPPSYVRVKVDICRIFAAATDLSNTIGTAPFEQALQMDNELDAAILRIPDALQARSFDQYITDSADVIMWSFNLELLYLKTKIVIYRPFLNRKDGSEAFNKARQLCLESATKTLRRHADIHQASQSGGQLEIARTYMSQIATHDFLLASTILCLELSMLCEEISDTRHAEDLAQNLAKKQEITDLLRLTCTIWTQDSDWSLNNAPALSAPHTLKTDMRQAAKALRKMLLKADSLSSPPTSLPTSDISHSPNGKPMVFIFRHLLISRSANKWKHYRQFVRFRAYQ